MKLDDIKSIGVVGGGIAQTAILAGYKVIPDVKEEIIQVLEGLCKKFDKTSVRVKDVPGDTGFIGNRVMGAARREAQKIVEVRKS